MKVLIVDDDDGDVMVMETCLHSNDNHLEILRAYDGGDAIAILKNESEPPDLILLDLNMPGIDGHAALEEIRKMPRHNSTPIVIFTTSAARRDIVRAYENRANAFVQKPGNLSEFRSTMDHIKSFWLKTVKNVHRHAHG
ncbi:response regulator [Hyphobacterium sp.]|uniref:response regulator n=1 Tax=Hyphobacterium sp. TaxID=2004662 RepID=UPI003BA8A123